jgi:hypothetical protein
VPGPGFGCSHPVSQPLVNRSEMSPSTASPTSSTSGDNRVVSPGSNMVDLTGMLYTQISTLAPSQDIHIRSQNILIMSETILSLTLVTLSLCVFRMMLLQFMLSPVCPDRGDSSGLQSSRSQRLSFPSSTAPVRGSLSLSALPPPWELLPQGLCFGASSLKR